MRRCMRSCSASAVRMLRYGTTSWPQRSRRSPFSCSAANSASSASAFGIGIGIVIQTLLNFLSISSSIGFYWSIQPYIKVGICMVLMALCGRWTFDYLTAQGLPLLWSVIVSIAGSLLLYFVALMLTDTLKWKNARHSFSIPW